MLANLTVSPTLDNTALAMEALFNRALVMHRANLGRARRRWGRDAHTRGGERAGGGRWESCGEKMGCDEWRETGRELEKIGFQGAGRERAGCCKLMCPSASDALTSSNSSGQINTCHTRN